MMKRKYETPAMNVYDIQPTCLLAGSNPPGTGGPGDEGGYVNIFHPSADGIMS